MSLSGSDETVSVSKGIFLFKNGFTKPNKPTKRKKIHYESSNSPFEDFLWYKSYSVLWDSLKTKIDELNATMFTDVLGNLVSFINSCYIYDVTEIPMAALLTGINMPDHTAQFNSLVAQTKQKVTPHVALVNAEDCSTIKYFVESIMQQFINDNDSDKDGDESDEERKGIKKNFLNFNLLKSWYNNCSKNVIKKNPLVVIIPDFESFNSKVIQEFILIISTYINVLPFVLVCGVATSLSTLHVSLPHHVTSKINIQVFNSESSTKYLNNILENVFFTMECPFQLGGKVFNLFTDIFLFYDLSVAGFIRNIQYAMLEHFSHGNVMALCFNDNQYVKNVLMEFGHEDCESARKLLSFRKLVESESYENRIKLLTDDDYFIQTLYEELIRNKKYIRRFHIFLKCLFFLVNDLPKCPLGKQLRELYALASLKNITKTGEYKECFQLLNFQSKEELLNKITNIINYLSSLLKVQEGKPNKLKDTVDTLKNYVLKLNSLTGDSIEIDSEPEEFDPQIQTVIGEKSKRQELKKHLIELSKTPSKPKNKYEETRHSLLNYLSKQFEVHLVEPSSLYFHEIFFFNDVSIQSNIIGTHRSAIHTALNDPHFYLLCTCCKLPHEDFIEKCMPDVCIAYKLHLECGKMINLYDWLQAFVSILEPGDSEDNSAKILKPELQARFTQAVAELEFLGFIKSSNRKADHVTRLTWGG